MPKRKNQKLGENQEVEKSDYETERSKVRLYDYGNFLPAIKIRP